MNSSLGGSPFRLVDTHCHLNIPPLGDDIPGAIARAAARGIDRLIIPAYDLASWDPIVALPRIHPGVHAALGLHPWVANQMSGEGSDINGAAWLKEHLAAAIKAAEAPIVAVGEIGLDSQVDVGEGFAPLAVQREVLTAQLELAVDLDLPVILHCRGAFDEMLEAIGRHKGRLRGVLHAFSRGPQVARPFIAAGLHLGLGGAVTRERARVRRAAAVLPLDRIVLETDAPSIGLDGIPPERTEPQHVHEVAEAIAALRGVPMSTIVEATTANACRLFDLPA